MYTFIEYCFKQVDPNQLTNFEQYLLEARTRVGQNVVAEGNTKVFWDQDDVDFVYQLPKTFWASAMEYRYGNFLFEVWRRIEAKKLFEQNNDLAKTTAAMSKFGGTPDKLEPASEEEVTRWIDEGPLEYDFIPIKLVGQIPIKYRGYSYQAFVKMNGAKLFHKLTADFGDLPEKTASKGPDGKVIEWAKLSPEEKKAYYDAGFGCYGYDIEFQNNDGVLQWLGYQPAVKWPDRVNRWKDYSNQGWFSTEDKDFYNLPKVDGERVLSADDIEKHNNLENHSRIEALKKLLIIPGYLQSRGFTPESSETLIKGITFDRDQTKRVYPLITQDEKGNVKIKKNKQYVPVMAPSKDIDQESVLKYNEETKEQPLTLEELTKEINKGMAELESKQKSLAYKAKELEMLGNGQNQKARSQAANKKNIYSNKIQIAIRKAMDNPIDEAGKPIVDSTGNPIPIKNITSENTKDIIDQLNRQKTSIQIEDPPASPTPISNLVAFSSKNTDDVKEESLAELVKNAPKLDPLEVILPANKSFPRTTNTGMNFGYQIENYQRNIPLEQRWKDENHAKYFISNGEISDITNEGPQVDLPYGATDKNPNGTANSPAFWGIKARDNNELTDQQREELKDKNNRAALLSFVNHKIQNSTLGKKVFKDYFAAFDKFINSKSEEDKVTLKKAYDAAAQIVKNIGGTIMGKEIDAALRSQPERSGAGGTTSEEDAIKLAAGTTKISKEERKFQAERAAAEEAKKKSPFFKAANELLLSNKARVRIVKNAAQNEAETQVPKDYPDRQSEVQKRTMCIAYYLLMDFVVEKLFNNLDSSNYKFIETAVKLQLQSNGAVEQPDYKDSIEKNDAFEKMLAFNNNFGIATQEPLVKLYPPQEAEKAAILQNFEKQAAASPEKNKENLAKKIATEKWKKDIESKYQNLGFSPFDLPKYMAVNSIDKQLENMKKTIFGEKDSDYFTTGNVELKSAPFKGSMADRLAKLRKDVISPNAWYFLAKVVAHNGVGLPIGSYVGIVRPPKDKPNDPWMFVTLDGKKRIGRLPTQGIGQILRGELGANGKPIKLQNVDDLMRAIPVAQEHRPPMAAQEHYITQPIRWNNKLFY